MATHRCHEFRYFINVDFQFVYQYPIPYIFSIPLQGTKCLEMSGPPKIEANKSCIQLAIIGVSMKTDSMSPGDVSRRVQMYRYTAN